MKRVIDLQFVKDALSELDHSLDSTNPDESYNTAIVVLSALVCGPDTSRLATFTGFEQEFVAAIRCRMILAELWTELQVFCDHWWTGGNVIRPAVFWLDVLIGKGLLVRKWDEESGDYRYRLHKEQASKQVH